MREAPFRGLGIRPPPLKVENKKPGQTDVAVCPGVCQDVNDDKKSPWCIALHTIYTIIAQDDLDRAYLRMELF